MALAQVEKLIVREMVARIEECGHFQGQEDADETACIVSNQPALERDPNGVLLFNIMRELGFPTYDLLYDWNDNTPTDEVLARMVEISRD